MRSITRAIGTAPAATSAAASCRVSTWNEHFILSTLQEASIGTANTPPSRRRYCSASAATASNAPSVMEAFINLVKLRAQKTSKFLAAVDGRNPASGIATDSFKNLQRKSLLAEIVAANDIGDAPKACKLIRSLYNPRTNLPSTPEVWLQQLRIYRLTKQGQAALDALTLHIPTCGITPSSEMYSSVLRALGVSGMGSKIIPILDDMKRRMFFPSARVLYDAMAGLISSNMKGEAVQLFNRSFLVPFPFLSIDC
jgi:hypothetical protein